MAQQTPPATPPPSEVSPCELFLHNVMGAWQGAGKGAFPTLPNPFQYEAQQCFSRVPVQTKAHFVHTALASWPPGKKQEKGMHYENGFLRCMGWDEISWAQTHNFGITEMLSGSVNASGTSATMASKTLGGAEYVTNTKRQLTVDPVRGTLEDRFSMVTEDVKEVTEHLVTEYFKVPDWPANYSGFHFY